MHKQLSISKRRIASILLLLFVAYYIDVNCFVHSHIVNGVTIIHSHVHNKPHNSSNDGGHTIWQINLIAAINSQFHFTETYEVLLDNAIDYTIEIIGCKQSHLAPLIIGIQFVRRAPPIVFSSI